VYVCNSATRAECLARCLFGRAREPAAAAAPAPGCPVFLFDAATRTVFGPFSLLRCGWQLVAEAFGGAFPAQAAVAAAARAGTVYSMHVRELAAHLPRALAGGGADRMPPLLEAETAAALGELLRARGAAVALPPPPR